MPGVVGVVEFGGAPVLPERIARTTSLLRHTGGTRCAGLSGDGFWLAAIAAGQPQAPASHFVSGDEHGVLVVEGNLYDDRQIAAAAGLGAEAGRAAALLKLLRAGGPAALARLHGEFALAWLEYRPRRMVLAADRLGTRRVLFRRAGAQLSFAPEPKAWLADPAFERRLDTAALRELLTFGAPLADRELLAGVAPLPAASCLRADTAGQRASRYWQPPPALPSDTPTGALLEQLDHLLVEAVRRRVRGVDRVALGLSGGLDSRLLAGYLAAERGLRCDAFTFGDQTTDEWRLARLVAQRLGFTQHHVTFDATDFAAHHQRVAWLSDGLINTCEFYFLGRAFAASGAAAISGHGGDDLSGRHLTRAMLRLDPGRLAALHFDLACRRLGDGATRLLAPDLVPSAATLRDEYLASFLAGGETDAGRLQLRYSLERSMRRNFTRIVDLPSAFVRFDHPFLDSPVVEFFYRLPAPHRAAARLYKTLLVERFPELARLPLPNRRLPLAWHHLGDGYYSLRNAAGRALRRMSYRPLRRLMPPEAEIGLNVEGYRRELRPLVHELVLAGAKRRPFFRPAAIAEVVAEHEQARANHSFLLHKLIALELFHRQVIEGHTPVGHRSSAEEAA